MQTTNTRFELGPQEAVREDHLRKTIVTIAEETFPENLGQEWIIHGFDHEGHLTFVEVEPRPDTVGYPRFKFVVSFRDVTAPNCVATYSFEDGRFTLLCTSPDQSEELPNAI